MRDSLFDETCDEFDVTDTKLDLAIANYRNDYLLIDENATAKQEQQMEFA